jgi:hypothetical protein
MKENFGYLIWAYLLVGGLVTAYSVSLITRSQRVARELESLAAELRGRGGPDQGA